MSSPKHLWSGDWERESAAISDELAGRRAPLRRDPAPPAPPPAPPAPRKPKPRRAEPRISPRLKRAIPIALAVAALVAAGAYGLTRVVGTPSSAQTAASSNAANGPIDWLGMQIEGLPPSTVVVATVAPGSPAEAAGLEPGDVFEQVNGRQVNATSDIARAINGLHTGDSVQIQVNRGSTLVTTHAALTAPPSGHP